MLDRITRRTFPRLRVNKEGVVAVSWYDRRGLPKPAVGPGNLIPPAEGYDARLRVSCDGGKTWLPSVRLNQVPMTGQLIEARGWAGLAASADGRFHAAWIGDSTGQAADLDGECGSEPVEMIKPFWPPKSRQVLQRD